MNNVQEERTEAPVKEKREEGGGEEGGKNEGEGMKEKGGI